MCELAEQSLGFEGRDLNVVLGLKVLVLTTVCMAIGQDEFIFMHSLMLQKSFNLLNYDRTVVTWRLGLAE